MDKIYVQFPKVGLGNMMLVWARAVVFAKLNNFPYVTSSWWGFHWGALLRKENRNRLYWKYFCESGYIQKLQVKLFSLTAEHLYNPDITLQMPTAKSKNTLFVFNKVNIDNDLFGNIRDHQALVKTELIKTLHPRIKKILDAAESPVLSVHIRRGDFKLANPLTALSFFIEAINIIRQTAARQIPVTIFSDASAGELDMILKLPATRLADEHPDIVDILLMSKSRIIILSRSSSFSYWSAFLSDALVIIPDEDWQEKIKDSSPSGNYTEIRWKEKDKHLTSILENALKSYHFKDGNFIQ